MEPNWTIAFMVMFPELVIAVFAILLLLLGAFSQETKSGNIFVNSALFVLFAVLLELILFPKFGVLFGNALIVDEFSRYAKILILISSIMSLFLSSYFIREQKLPQSEFVVLLLLATTGMMLMTSAGNMLSLYLALELQSLALYVLVTIHRDHLRSSEAGLKYFILGSLSSGMLLYGISLLYGYTGHIGFHQIALFLAGNELNLAIIFAIVFILAGLAFKISLVPFHMWTPDVYEGAPTAITAFLSTAAKVAAVALLARFVMTSFKTTAITGSMPAWQQIVIFMALSTMIVGAFAGIGQRNLKRLMAYSSITHMGYILVGLAAGSVLGIQSMLLYMTVYIVMTLACFASILSLKKFDHYIEMIDDLAGLKQHSPLLRAILTVQMFSLVSMPPLAGFLGKWYSFSAAVDAGLIPLVVIGMMASVVGAFYYLRIVKIMFFDPSQEKISLVNPGLQYMALFSTFFILFFIVFAFWIVAFAERAAQSLLE